MTILPFICLGIGLIVGFQKMKDKFLIAIDFIINITLIVLMLTIGMNIGVNNSIMSKLNRIGINCFVIALFAIIFSIIFTLIAEKTILPLDKIRENLNSENMSLNNEVNVSEEEMKKMSPLVLIMPLSIVAGVVLGYFAMPKEQGQESMFRKKSRDLYNYYHQVGLNIDKICMGTDSCGECKGNSCIVGYTKSLIKHCLEESELIQSEAFIPKVETSDKHYDKEQVLESLRMTLSFIKKDHRNVENKNIHEIRKNLEMLLFATSIQQMNDWAEYSRCLVGIDEAAARRVFRSINN